MSGCRPLSNQEIEQMSQSMNSIRDKTLFLLGLKTGFRISELLSIKIADVIQYNEIKSSLRVEKCNTKGKVASRTVPLSKDSIELLKTYVTQLPKDQIYLFESNRGKLSRIQAWRIIKDASKLNKLTGPIATHSMRKTFASRVYNKLERDILKTQKAMGHKSINSTVAYLSVNDEEITQAIMEI